MADHSDTRRTFLRTTLSSAAALGLSGAITADDESAKGLPTRPLGRTGVRVSILCLGGWHIGAVKDPAQAIKIMHAAVDHGLTFFDNAWDYHDGKSEEIMGQALAQGGYRQKVFLMTKNCERDARGTRKNLEDSLRRLRTDVIDLWQFHEINYDNDPDWVIEKGGLNEALKAQKEGKVRFLGFTGHKDPRIHLRMLGKHKWDTVQMPINICDYFYRSFARQVVPEALRQGTAPLGMKSLGGGQPGRLVAARVCSAEEAIRYALSQDIVSLVTGIDSMNVLEQNLRIARGFKNMSDEEQKALREKVKEVAGDGRHERFKSTQFFDGVHHQQQHGLTKAEVEG